MRKRKRKIERNEKWEIRENEGSKIRFRCDKNLLFLLSSSSPWFHSSKISSLVSLSQILVLHLSSFTKRYKLLTWTLSLSFSLFPFFLSSLFSFSFPRKKKSNGNSSGIILTFRKCKLWQTDSRGEKKIREKEKKKEGEERKERKRQYYQKRMKGRNYKEFSLIAIFLSCFEKRLSEEEEKQLLLSQCQKIFLEFLSLSSLLLPSSLSFIFFLNRWK